MKKPRVKILEEKFSADNYEEKGLKAQGVRLATREVEAITIETKSKSKQLDLI